MVWKDVEDAPAAVVKGNTINWSYSVVASAPEVPSFTCSTSFVVTNSTSTATNIPTTICKTPAIKTMCMSNSVLFSIMFRHCFYYLKLRRNFNMDSKRDSSEAFLIWKDKAAMQ